MLIDWFTVLAQIINFLVLVFLLKRFLYKPITNAMDRREREIASRLDEALKKKEGAEAEAARYKSKVNEISLEREEMLRKAAREANTRKDALLKAAAEEVDRKKTAWEEAVREEKRSFLDELRRRASLESFSVARRALEDLAHARLEEEMLESFKKHIAGMSEKDKGDLKNILSKEQSITVRSAFEIEDKRSLTEFLQRELLDKAQVNYESSPGLIAGIELKGNSYKAAWSLKDYLDKMEETISGFIDSETEK